MLLGMKSDEDKDSRTDMVLISSRPTTRTKQLQSHHDIIKLLSE
jgi:hypothetical protein